MTTANRDKYVAEIEALRDKARDHVTALLTMATKQRAAGLRAMIVGYAQTQREAIDRWFETESANTCETLFRSIVSRSVDDTRRSLEESWKTFQRMTPSERKANITENEEAARRLAKALANANAQLASKRKEHLDLLNQNIASCKQRVAAINTQIERVKRGRNK
jgi:hypothetical protein